jgi:Ca-activated chloride channel family protein
MLTFASPWLYLFLPLPLLLRRILPSYRETRTAIRLPFFQKLARLSDQQPESGSVVQQSSLMQHILFAIIWCSIVTALARPQWLEPPIIKELPTRDLLLAIDLSGSMETEDIISKDGSTVDRLTAVKEVIDDFLKKRQGDRVGILVFGTGAFVQVPFTQDLEASREMVQETAVRMAGPKTAFGDAIGLGITLFDRSTVTNRVMIVLTDGNDTQSRVPPAEASRIAKDKGITIHTVAFGDPTSVGEEQLDAETLNAVAKNTGGRYFYAADREELEAIYKELDRIETRKVETISHRPRLDLFHWPLAFALVLSMGYHCILAFHHHFTSRKMHAKDLTAEQQERMDQ